MACPLLSLVKLTLSSAKEEERPKCNILKSRGRSFKMCKILFLKGKAVCNILHPKPKNYIYQVF